MTDLKELKRIVRFCQKNGILKLKSGDVEIELSKEKHPQQPKKNGTGDELKGDAPQPFPSWDSLSPEEKLLWSSTSGVPQPQ